MAGEPLRWECELWSYLSNGDGMCCPVYARCHIRQGGGWCPDDNKEHLSRLNDSGQFSIDNPDFGKTRSESGRSGRVFQLVERLAQKQLKRGRVYCPPVPSSIVSLADEYHPIEVRVVPLKAYHGALWPSNKGWMIYLRKDDTSDTQRFTLFHEAFHILAHCKAQPIFRTRNREAGGFNELLAEHFAACVLMPAEWVAKKWAEVKDIRQMAEIFGVQELAMWVRLKQLGLVE